MDNNDDNDYDYDYNDNGYSHDNNDLIKMEIIMINKLVF